MEGFDLSAAKNALFVILQYHHLTINKEELFSRFDREKLKGWSGVQNIVKTCGLKSKLIVLESESVCEEVGPTPSLVRLKDGKIMVLASMQPSILLLKGDDTEPIRYEKDEFSSAWTGEIMVISQGYTWRGVKEKYQLSWFFRVMGHYKRYLWECAAAACFFQAMGIGLPLITQVIVDKVIGNHGVSTLTVLGSAMISFFCIQSILSGLRTYLMNHTASKMDAILGTELFRHLIALPLPYYENRPMGDTLVRVQALRSIREFLTGQGITLLIDIAFSVFFVVFMFCYSVPLTLISLGIIPLFLLLNWWALPHIQERLTAVWNTGTVNQSFLVEAVSNIETIKSLAAEPQFVYRWEQMMARYASRVFSNAQLHTVLEYVGNTFQGGISLFLLWYGGHMVMRGEFTLGQLIAFQMIFAQATAPFMRLMGILPHLRKATLGMERIGEVMRVPREAVFSPRDPSVRVKGSVSFQNVYFRYRVSLEPVLKDFSIQIRPAEKIGIAGRSGSGKSTFANLLQRLYFQEQGNILIDGIRVDEIPFPTLREDIVVVSQDSYLFHRSIRENIALMKPMARMEEIIAAAEAADAHSFIVELEDGYDTLVGEQGATLSGGQCQRIALARALLANPRILVLDEATSALDYHSERIVLANLLRFGKAITIVMIAHRLSALECCDRIIVMENGVAVDEGSPEELRTRAGLYREMYLQQMEG